jgi:hypothetical protein
LLNSIKPHSLLIRFKLLVSFFQLSPLLLDLDDHLFDPLLLSLISLLYFPDHFVPPCSHLILLEMENLFFVPLKYLLSEECHAVLFEHLNPAKRGLLLDLSNGLSLLVNKYFVREALLNISEELIEPRVDVI